jgi:sec-independent protein translocase protein TatB
MFGFSWSEILIIGVVALVLIGPNDLPRAMRTAAKWMSTGRKLAREFQGHVDDLVREAELDELREKARNLAMKPLSSHLEAMVDPNREIAQALSAAQDSLESQAGTTPEAPAAIAASDVVAVEAVAESGDHEHIEAPSASQPAQPNPAPVP